MEKWGPFGRSWANKYYEGHMIEPRYSSLVGIPLAWTSGTGGSITGEHGIGLAKKRWWPQAVSKESQMLHRTVKTALDGNSMDTAFSSTNVTVIEAFSTR